MAITRQDQNKPLLTIFRNHAAFTALIVITFLFLGLLGILNHEIWRDEAQAWLIARDSSSIINLFENLRYEGHPALWYLLLYWLTRFTHNPIAMQVLHIMLATAVVYLFVRYSPFTTLQKIFFSFGYFALFEYALISRSYVLAFLLVLLFCILFRKRPNNYPLLSVLLFFLSNTSFYGLVLAFSLGTALILEYILERKKIEFSSIKQSTRIISLLVFILGMTAAVVQLLPPPDSGYAWDIGIKASDVVAGSLYPRKFVQAVSIIWNSYVPIPIPFKLNFWNTNILFAFPIKAPLWAFLFSLGLLFASIMLLIHKPFPLFAYLCGTLGIIAFTYLKFPGSLRHHGHLFILFLACLWISSYYDKSDLLSSFLNRRLRGIADFLDKYKNQLLTIILAAHLIAGIFAYSVDLFYPFSSSKEAARFIKKQQMSDLVIVGSEDKKISPLSALLDKKIYYPESNTFGSFVVLNNQRKRVKSRQVLDQVSEMIKQKDQDILLILDNKLTYKYQSNVITVKNLKQYPRSIDPQEDYYLYLIQKKSI